MSKFGGLLARKPNPAEMTQPDFAPVSQPPGLDLDEELFSAMGAQLGGENEALRNLLLDANHKISELDDIKASVAKLVEPVTKALSAFEAEKTEKVSLQTVLNNTRTAYGRLRNEVGALEKKASTFEAECVQLRQELSATTTTIRSLESAKAELTADIAARRAHIADLELTLQQETAANKSLGEENRRLSERATAGDKRNTQLESELHGTRQKLALCEDEKRALQISLDKTIGESARLARRLTEAEANLSAAQGRIRHIETNLAELTAERTRLASTVEEINERHASEFATQRMRFEALQARSQACDKLLNDARDHLIGRAEEIRVMERRVNEMTIERDAAEARRAEAEAARLGRENEFKDVQVERDALQERLTTLTRALAARDNGLARAEEKTQLLTDRLALLESEMETARQVAENERNELTAAVKRERLERALTEGALETARKDFSRLMREVMVLQRRQHAAQIEPEPVPANAA